MCYPVYEMVHVKELLIRKSSLSSGGSRVFFSLSEWTFTVYRNGSSDRFFMMDPLSYFSFQPVLHNWCNKGYGMHYPVSVG